MKVIITGGTGLIGRALAENLANDQHRVIILSRNPEKAAPFPEGVEIVKWDARTEAGWAEHANGADAIVNLAGATLNRRWTDAYKKRIRESRLHAGEAIVAAVNAAEKKPGVVIQMSAVGYYGPRGDEKITEETRNGNDFLASICRDWEDATKPVEEMGVRRVVARTGLVLSTKGGALERLLPVFRFFIGGAIGSGKQYYAWIHIGDVVNAFRYFIENKKTSGVYNLTAPNPVTNRAFVKALSRALNRPSMMFAPGFGVKLVFGEMSTVVLDGQRVVPKRLQEAGFEFRFSDPEAAFRHLLYSGAESA